MKFKYITVGQGQSLMDICIQEYGCVEGLSTLCKDNKDQLTSVTQIITAGMRLKIRTEVPKFNESNQAIVAQYKSYAEPKTVANGTGEALFISGFIIH